MVKRSVAAKSSGGQQPLQARKALTATGGASSAAAQKREAQRKALMELKRKNKLAMSEGGGAGNGDNAPVEIVGVSDVTSKSDDVV